MTLLNKLAFSVVAFPYPYTLTAIHMAVTWAACTAIFQSIHQQQQQAGEGSKTTLQQPPPRQSVWVRLLGDRLLKPTPAAAPTTTHRLVIAAFSVLFTLNIAVGNLSLRHVSVNFNQVMRSLVPVFTMWSSTWLFGATISQARRLAVWPVVLGVAMAVAGDRFTVTPIGFWVTLACAILASAKVVVSTELLSGNPSYQMHPLRLLHLMSIPALVQCLFLAAITGEASQLIRQWHTDLDPFTTGNWIPVIVVGMSSIWAFSLNISALQAYKLTSALTCCIAAAVKQVLMIVGGTLLFSLRITWLNGAGILVVLVASTYYSYVCIVEDQTTDKEKGHDKEDEDLESSLASEEKNDCAIHFCCIEKENSNPDISSGNTKDDGLSLPLLLLARHSSGKGPNERGNAVRR